MSVRPHPKKPGWQIIDIGWGKDRTRIPFEGSREDALLHETAIKRQERKTPVTVASSLAHAWPDFVLWLQANKTAGTVGEYTFNWGRLSPLFGPFHFSSINQTLVNRYKAQRIAAGVCKRTIQKELAVLSSFLRWACEEKHYINEMPRLKGYPRKETKARLPVVWSADEIKRLFDALPEDRRLLVAMLYQVGLRKTEAFRLKAEDVLSNGMLRIIGKGNKERLVPIVSPQIWAALQDLAKTVRRGWLFPNPRTKEPYKDIRVLLENAKDRAGITKKITPHLLRHCCFTHAIQSGVHAKAVQDWAGHSDLSTTQIYIHLAGEDIKREAEKLQGTFAAMPDVVTGTVNKKASKPAPVKAVQQK